MKPHGAKCEHEQERNDELMKVFHDLIGKADYISMPDIYKALVEQPSSRFWVSEERASIVVSAMMRGEKLSKMRDNKREMFREIYKRCMRLRKDMPNLSVYELCFQVVRQPAPKFYLTPGSAKVIVCKSKRLWYEARKRKMRFLY